MTALAMDVRELSFAETCYVAGGTGQNPPAPPPPPPPREPVHETVAENAALAGLFRLARIPVIGPVLVVIAVVVYPTPAGVGSDRDPRTPG